MVDGYPIELIILGDKIDEKERRKILKNLKTLKYLWQLINV